MVVNEKGKLLTLFTSENNKFYRLNNKYFKTSGNDGLMINHNESLIRKWSYQNDNIHYILDEETVFEINEEEFNDILKDVIFNLDIYKFCTNK